ncbi:MAG: L,D-transpeptidase [Methylocystis sp.]
MLRKLSRSLMLLAALLGSAAPVAAKVEIRVDLDRQRITVVKNREAPIVWKISSGRPGFETPTGRFIVQRLDADHFSDEYDQAPMPYAIFFSRGLAIHGTTMGGLGRPASHGCVRLSVDHARELYDWVEQYGAGAIEISGDATSLARLQDDDRPPRRKNGKRGRRRDLDDEPPVADRYNDQYYDYDRIIRAR